MEDELVEFVDAEQFMGNQQEKITYKIIVLHYLKKIGDLAAKEFRGGFYMQVETKLGQLKEIYIQDTRDTYCNAIEYFYNILIPNFDDKIKAITEEFEDQKQEIENKFVKASSPNETIILGEGFYGEESDKILLETYKQHKLKIYIEFFKHLNVFLKENNYMEQGKRVMDIVE